jgi:hypothetical protein
MTCSLDLHLVSVMPFTDFDSRYKITENLFPVESMKTLLQIFDLTTN